MRCDHGRGRRRSLTLPTHRPSTRRSCAMHRDHGNAEAGSTVTSMRRRQVVAAEAPNIGRPSREHTLRDADGPLLSTSRPRMRPATRHCDPRRLTWTAHCGGDTGVREGATTRSTRLRRGWQRDQVRRSRHHRPGQRSWRRRCCCERHYTTTSPATRRDGRWVRSDV
jgi:hypothetical protein